MELQYLHDLFPICLLFLQVEAFKRITLSQLPAVLILHLKRFIFNQAGGSQKLSKEISYPMELEMPKGRER